MATIEDFAARGKIVEVHETHVVFHPTGTNYQLHLESSGSTFQVSDRPIEAIIRVKARKVWTVPSGGNFIAPIFGPPRIIQGRVKWLDEQMLVVQAGAMIVAELPLEDQAIDLANGVIGVGTLVNVTAMPGATIEMKVAVETRT